MRRVVLIGPGGSGKTTLDRWLERHFELPFTDLDDVFWRPGWQKSAVADFRSDMDRITAQPLWAVAGNHTSARDLLLPRADTVVWLDLPLITVLQRSARRALRQWRTREPICNGNRQTLARIPIGRDALLTYTLRTFHERRRNWPALLAARPHPHIVRLRQQDERSARQHASTVSQAGNTPVDR